MLSTRLYLAQRLSALVLAPLVLLHLLVIIYAVRGGLDAAEILSRTRGSHAWFAVYGIFSIAVSIHGAIGVRVIAHEWLGVKGRLLDILSWGIFLLLLIPGLKAVYSVTH